MDWDVLFVIRGEQATPAETYDYLNSFNLPGSDVIFPQPTQVRGHLRALAQHLNLAHPELEGDQQLSKRITKRLKTTHGHKSAVVLAFHEKTDLKDGSLEPILSLATLNNVRVIVFTTQDRETVGRAICSEIGLVARSDSARISGATKPTATKARPSAIAADRWNLSTLLTPLRLGLISAGLLIATLASSAMYMWEEPEAASPPIASQPMTPKPDTVKQVAPKQITHAAKATPAQTVQRVKRAQTIPAVAGPVAFPENKEEQRPTHKIQLVSLTDFERAKAFVERHKDAGQLQINEDKSGTNAIYRVSLVGYRGYNEAASAIAGLPLDLQQLQPFTARVSNSNE